MPVKYIPYHPNTVQGQAILNNITRTRRVLRYRDNDKVYERIQRGMPYYELEKIESVGNNPENMLIRGECISACAYLKDKNIKIDLVYIDPPFASGADYAKRIFIRKNPKLAEKIRAAEQEMDNEMLRSFEEKMYGDIWKKEDYLNWMYENLQAIKSVMSEEASIFVHLSWHIGHYVKILMDEVFGEENFRNEIIWHYRTGNISDKQYQKKHDTIFFYSKEDEWLFIPQEIKEYYFCLYGPGFKSSFKGRQSSKDEYGEYRISLIDDVWDISGVFTLSQEHQQYDTQKPEALLERIIKASSNEGMVIADLFGGSGVTAKVAHDSKRKFIHCDVGINSIQTTRDRLVAAGAEFDIYDIQDGVSLFRNPVQTMDKMKSLITGLKNEDALDSFWEGGIQDSKLGLVPVYIPNLLDHSTKVLDIPLINRVINEAMPDLPDGTKQVIVFYVDIENETELKKFISEYNATGIDIVLRDLKSILDDVVINDEIDYKMKKSKTGFEIEIKSFTSDRLIQKIDAYNQKKSLNSSKKELLEENGEGNGDENEEENSNGKKKKPFVPIAISKHGLELIELISLDCTSKEGIWKSDFELKIDKNGYVILNGKKTKEFWNAKIVSEKKPLRMKIRNIAGDESVIVL
jgi:adenine-specific DNA-methyltransferase